MNRTFSPESLHCLGALKNSPLASSSGVGWTSCLLDHVEGDRACDLHETHVTPDLTVVVATRGEHDVEVLRDGRWLQAVYQVGAVGMNPGGQSTRLRWRNRRPGSPFRTAHLYVPGALLAEANELVRRPGQPAPEAFGKVLVSNDRAAAGLVDALLNGMETGAPDIFAETGVRWLAADLAWRSRTGMARDEDARSPGLLCDRRLARAVEYLTANLRRAISVDDLAREAGISPFHFARLFRRKVGVSPHSFLTQRRLEKAHRLLTTTDLPVAAVGVECGYPLASSFSAAFSRRFGYPPSDASRRGAATCG